MLFAKAKAWAVSMSCTLAPDRSATFFAAEYSTVPLKWKSSFGVGGVGISALFFSMTDAKVSFCSMETLAVDVFCSGMEELAVDAAAAAAEDDDNATALK